MKIYVVFTKRVLDILDSIFAILLKFLKTSLVWKN